MEKKIISCLFSVQKDLNSYGYNTDLISWKTTNTTLYKYGKKTKTVLVLQPRGWDYFNIMWDCTKSQKLLFISENQTEHAYHEHFNISYRKS